MFFVILVLNNIDYLTDVLDAWDAAGVNGVTILASTGLARLRDRGGVPEDFPLIPRLEDFLRQNENTNRTIFSIVDSQEMADRLLAVTESIVGDLDQPNTGIMAILPVLKAKGLHRKDSHL